MSTTTVSTERFTREPVGKSYFSDLLRIAFPKQPESLAAPTMFTAPHPGSGVSFVCSCIAAELACEGGKVLLADAHALISLARQDGRFPLPYCERVEPGRVWVLGMSQLATADTDSRAVYLSAASVLDRLVPEFSHIIIDAPAISESDDALLLSTSVHGIVLLAKRGRTTKREIVNAQRKMASLGGRVLGSIYNSGE
jgi:Mrp family chromosome partitioning ATPase